MDIEEKKIYWNSKYLMKELVDLMYGVHDAFIEAISSETYKKSKSS